MEFGHIALLSQTTNRKTVTNCLINSQVNELFLLHWSHWTTVVTKQQFVSILCYLQTLRLTCFVAQWYSSTSTRSVVCSVEKSRELVISVAWNFELRPTWRGHLLYYFVTNACGTRIRNDLRLYLFLCCLQFLYIVKHNFILSCNFIDWCLWNLESNICQWKFLVWIWRQTFL